MSFFDFFKTKTKDSKKLKEEFNDMTEGLDYLDKTNIDDYTLYQFLTDSRIQCYNMGNSVELELNLRVSDSSYTTYRYTLGKQPYKRQLVLKAAKILYEVADDDNAKLMDRYSTSIRLSELEDYNFIFKYTPQDDLGLLYFRFGCNSLSVLMNEKTCNMLKVKFNHQDIKTESESEIAYTCVNKHSSN